MTITAIHKCAHAGNESAPTSKAAGVAAAWRAYHDNIHRDYLIGVLMHLLIRMSYTSCLGKIRHLPLRCAGMPAASYILSLLTVNSLYHESRLVLEL